MTSIKREEPSIGREPRIAAAAERQAQAWSLAAEIADRKLQTPCKAGAAEVRPYVALSREEGCAGEEVAELLGRRLGWEVLDKNLLDRIAQRYRLSRSMLDLLDETPSNWAYDTFGSWFDRRLVTHHKYVFLLCRVVLSAARCASVVLVGRGAQFMLPREKGLAVRLVAPASWCVSQVISRQGLSAAAAYRHIYQVNAQRRDFVRRFFHHDIDDPRLYDLVINVASVGPETAADLVVETMERRMAGASL